VRVLDAAKARLRRARARSPVVDHAVLAYQRHNEVAGGQVAAAITYYGFLSFFPLLALTFAVVGYLSVIYPDAKDNVTAAIEAAFPGLLGTGTGQINIDDIVSARTGAGVVGILGLLYAGLGGVDALRTGLRRVFGTDQVEIGLVRKKTGDVVVLILLGLALLASVAVSTLATDATQYALGQVGLAGSFAAAAVLKVCLLYTNPSPRDGATTRMPAGA
jgi:membrane protein